MLPISHTPKRLAQSGLFAGLTLLAGGSLHADPAPRPNIIVIFMDDLGYNDVGARTYPSPPNQHPVSGPPPNFGSNSDPDIPLPNQAFGRTPAIDRLAAEGLQMTQFYATPKCSPSRASLLTGRYDRRAGVTAVFFPNHTNGFNTTEATLPELLRQEGYATGMVGKWHLGYNPTRHEPFQMMPTRHGFQEFLGTPHSNDMDDFDLIQNETVLAAHFASPAKQAQLTWRYTEFALDFIQRRTAEDHPFFLYFAHSMTHIPCWPSDREFANADGTIWPKFQGTTGTYYYDVAAEVDHSVGRILSKLDELGIANNTIVIFTSDNGPWLSASNINQTSQAVGSAYPLRDGKHTTWEGGARVPFFVRWPGRIPAGSLNAETGALMDLLPTFVGLAGGSLPTDRTIDGLDLLPLWENPGGTVLNRAYGLHNGSTLEAVVKGRWKLRSGKLYDLFDINDQEQTDVSAANPAKETELESDSNAIKASIDAERNSNGLFTDYEVEVSETDLTVPEGGTATFQVQLSANPGKNVSVRVSRFLGDTNLDVAAGSSLNFTTANWSVPQSVTLAAAADADADHDGATFRITTNDSANSHVREVFAREQDAQAPPAVVASRVWPSVDAVNIQDLSTKLVGEGSLAFAGQANPVGTTYQWLKVSGPGHVHFTDPTAARTGLSFSADGPYQVRMKAWHPGAEGFRSIDFSVVVNPTALGPVFAYKYEPELAYDANRDDPSDNVWQNEISPGSRDWSLSATVTRTPSDPAPNLSFIDSAFSFGGGSVPGGGTSASLQAFGTGSATIEIWFKPASLPVAAPQVLWETGGDIGASLTLVGNTLRFAVDDGGSNVANGAVAEAVLSPSPSRDGFIHAVGVVNLTTDEIHLFIDGVLAANPVGGGVKAIPSVSNWCGSSQSGLGTIADQNGNQTTDTGHVGGNDLLSGSFGIFAGQIAHFLVYPKALTATQVAELATGPSKLTEPTIENMAPVVSAGSDQAVAYNDAVLLNGSVSDDGLPTGSPVTVQWHPREVPGPVNFAGTAAFGNAASPSTSVSFDLPGTYVLWMEADDSEVKVWDDISITVAPLTYSEWASGIAFATGEAGFAANPDGDPWSNGWEWILNSNPLSHDSSMPGYFSDVQADANGVSFAFEFDIPRNREPALMLETSDDLRDPWTARPDITPSVEILDAQTNRWSFEIQMDMTGKTSQFGRMRLVP